MTRRYFIGLYSGASQFGVDAALVRAEGVGIELALSLEHFLQLPFSNELRDLLVRITTGATPDIRHLGMAHRVLGETFALAARQLIDRSRLPSGQVLAIGCPGTLLWHDAEGRYPATLYLGMMGVLAERTGLTVVSDFSSRDLALGGQGLPVSAMIDALLFHQKNEHRLLINLGSVASVVWLPSRAAVEAGRAARVGVRPVERDGAPCWRDAVGFQAAPCTMLLDGLMRLLTNAREPFDSGGKHAVQGRCLEPLLERWMQNHFFAARPPKCVPRPEFGPEFLSRAVEQAKRLNGNLHDLLCTMTHFVAHAIVHAVRTLLPATPARVFLSGRGVRNGFLWHLLQQKLGATPLEKLDVLGIAAEARNAVAHAGMTALTLDGVPINLPAVTGASGQRVLGQLTPGSTANWARCLAWMARQSAQPHSAAA